MSIDVVTLALAKNAANSAVTPESIKANVNEYTEVNETQLKALLALLN